MLQQQLRSQYLLFVEYDNKITAKTKKNGEEVVLKVYDAANNNSRFTNKKFSIINIT